MKAGILFDVGGTCFMLLFQYLLSPLCLSPWRAVALRWRRIGLALHIATAGIQLLVLLGG